VWGVDPVHPLLHGFRLLVDMLETEMEGQISKNKRKAASQKQPSAKKPRVETPRPSWIQHNPATAERRDWNDKRGGQAAADEAAVPAGDRAAGAGEDGAEAAEVQLPQRQLYKTLCFFLHRKKNVKIPLGFML
jgi:hypothetical protein